MKICKKCGMKARPNTWQQGYYCDSCKNLSFSEVEDHYKTKNNKQ